MDSCCLSLPVAARRRPGPALRLPVARVSRRNSVVAARRRPGPALRLWFLSTALLMTLLGLVACAAMDPAEPETSVPAAEAPTGAEAGQEAATGPEASAEEPAPAADADTAAEMAGSPRLHVTVTAGNVRQGPGLDFPVAFHVAAGDSLVVEARNAEGNWLQVRDPRPDPQPGPFWLHITLGRLDPPDTLDTLAMASTQAPPAPAVVAEEQTPAADTDTTAEAVVPVDWTRHVAVEGDYHFLGNPDAPVMIIDIGDFL